MQHNNTDKTLVHINVGSNQDKEQNIACALQLLRQAFGDIHTSSIYTSTAVGFDGEDFHNVGVNLWTHLEPQDLLIKLRAIEDIIGRDRSQAKFSSREIDLDIIFFGDKIIKDMNIPRDDILKYQFVLTPFMELIKQ